MLSESPNQSLCVGIRFAAVGDEKKFASREGESSRSRVRRPIGEVFERKLGADRFYRVGESWHLFRDRSRTWSGQGEQLAQVRDPFTVVCPRQLHAADVECPGGERPAN